jgi:hypothetical protein
MADDEEHDKDEGNPDDSKGVRRERGCRFREDENGGDLESAENDGTRGGREK